MKLLTEDQTIKRKMKPQMDTDTHELIGDIRQIISQARSLTRRSVNSLQVISNYLIGMRIVVEEQGGQERAEYGKESMKLLTKALTEEFGKGYSLSNLKNIRQFYLTYSGELKEKSQTLSAQSNLDKSQTLSGKFDATQIVQALSAQLPLSWSHYLFLMGISDVCERRFYEIESANENLLNANYSVSRDIYNGYILEDIYCENCNEYFSLSLLTGAFRTNEKAPIACGKEHFKSLGKEVEFAVTNSFEEFTGEYV